MRIPPAGYAPAPDALAGRAILVTGAGAGIGYAAACALAAHGAEVVALDRSVRGLERLHDAIAAAGGAAPALYPMDLRGATPDDHAALAERVGAELGHLDGLAHVAGVLGALSPVEHQDPATWLEVLHVNLNAPFLLTRACLPLLRAAADASVVFVSDAVGRRGRAYWGAYAASKFGVEGLAQTLADELEADGTVRVNTLDPGPVRTAMRLAAFPGGDRAAAAPEDVAGAFVWLLGPASKGVSGRALDAG